MDKLSRRDVLVATDVGSLPMFWASFNNAPRRIQNGGWARQVTQEIFRSRSPSPA